LKQGVDGHASGIDGRYSGRGHDHHALWAFFAQLMQKRCFACSCLSGQKNVGRSVPNIVESEFELQVGVENSIHEHSIY
jgi:hypothetical protein